MDAVRTDNNFNTLRVVLALMVAFYHLVFLSGVAAWSGLEASLSKLAEIGVQGFFVLSGYLVFASLERSSSLWLYAEKRLRRLYPAYAVVVIISVVAAFVFTEQLGSNLSAVARYLGANLAFANFLAPSLPGVFETNRVPEINGALWTLKIEVMFYLILPGLAWTLRVAGRFGWLFLLLIYVGANVWRIGLAGVEPYRDFSHQLPGQLNFFVTGMALYKARLSGWRLHACGAIGTVFFAMSLMSPLAEPLRAIGLGCLLVWLAIGPLRFPDAARSGDISYGIYILHFPIIQTMVALGVFRINVWLGAVTALTVTILAALVLWRLVERPVLRSDSAYRKPKREELSLRALG